MIYSLHPYFHPDNPVVTYNAQTIIITPFSNASWDIPRFIDDHFLSSVLGIRGDDNGVVWMLDIGNLNRVRRKLVGWKTKTNQLEGSITYR